VSSDSRPGEWVDSRKIPQQTLLTLEPSSTDL
jgi:hypothetical protein